MVRAVWFEIGMVRNSGLLLMRIGAANILILFFQTLRSSCLITSRRFGKDSVYSTPNRTAA